MLVDRAIGNMISLLSPQQCLELVARVNFSGKDLFTMLEDDRKKIHEEVEKARREFEERQRSLQRGGETDPR